MDYHHHNLLFVLTILLSCSNSESWTWFSSSSSSSSQSTSEETPTTRDGSFSIEAFNDQKAIRLVENAKNGLAGMSPCWQSAYRRLFSGCSASLAVDEKRSRFAWHLSDCFQRDSGRPSFPVCHENSPMNKCLKSLGDHDHKVYLEFYLETNSICNQLQFSISISPSSSFFFFRCQTNFPFHLYSDGRKKKKIKHFSVYRFI